MSLIKLIDKIIINLNQLVNSLFEKPTKLDRSDMHQFSVNLVDRAAILPYLANYYLREYTQAQ